MEELKKITFSKKFFAKRLSCSEKKLQYAIVAQQVADCYTKKTPVIKVDGIKNYVFDIMAGSFIKLTNRMTVNTATVRRSTNGSINVFVDGELMVTIKRRAFKAAYANQVLHDELN